MGGKRGNENAQISKEDYQAYMEREANGDGDAENDTSGAGGGFRRADEEQLKRRRIISVGRNWKVPGGGGVVGGTGPVTSSGALARKSTEEGTGTIGVGAPLTKWRVEAADPAAATGTATTAKAFRNPFASVSFAPAVPAAAFGGGGGGGGGGGAIGGLFARTPAPASAFPSAFSSSSSANGAGKNVGVPEVAAAAAAAAATAAAATGRGGGSSSGSSNGNGNGSGGGGGGRGRGRGGRVRDDRLLNEDFLDMVRNERRGAPLGDWTNWMLEYLREAERLTNQIYAKDNDGRGSGRDKRAGNASASSSSSSNAIRPPAAATATSTTTATAPASAPADPFRFGNASGAGATRMAAAAAAAGATRPFGLFGADKGGVGGKNEATMTTTTNAASAPSSSPFSGFNFGAPPPSQTTLASSANPFGGGGDGGGSGKSSFGFAYSTAPAAAAPANRNDSGGGNSNNNDDEEEGDEEEGPTVAARAPTDKNEQIVHEVRAKYYKFEGSEWKGYAAGHLRLTTTTTSSSSSDGKAGKKGGKAVLRNGTGAVFLNIGISKGMKFESQLNKKGGTGFVRFIGVADAVKGPEKFMFKVRAEHLDGLHSALEDMAS